MSSPNPTRSRWLSLSLAEYAHLANIAIAVITLCALVFTAIQVNESAHQGREEAVLQREIAANASWERYMEMASSRPEFAGGLDYASLTAERKTAYLWFVERMLIAGEQILAIDPSDRQWKLAIQVESRIHNSYIRHDDFLSESYCSFTVQLRMAVIEAFAASDRILAAALRARHNRCLAEGYSE